MSKSNHFIGQPILKQLLFHLDKEEILKISRENGGEKYIKRFDAWQHLCMQGWETLVPKYINTSHLCPDVQKVRIVS